MSSTLTVESILEGTAFGRTQSVGLMDVVPLLDGGGIADDSFAPPDFSVGTSDYGTVQVRNENPDLPTILPTGAGWVTKQHAQDHAVPSGCFVGAGDSRTITTARCIESSQGGYIQDAKDMLILPASLRARALSGRHEEGYSLLWDDITKFNQSLDVDDHGGHLVRFLDKYQGELDQFVAEFELVPDQLGAIVLIGGRVVGVEMAPNVPFWERLWTPLVRVCYGSLALLARRKLGDTPPPTRTRLEGPLGSLANLKDALALAGERSTALVEHAVKKVRSTPLVLAGRHDDVDGELELVTAANTQLAGQLVRRGGSTPYVSLCAAGA